MRTEVIVEPTDEPLSIHEVKSHLRITHNDDEPELQRLINAARVYCEGLLNISLITQTRVTFYDRFGVHHHDRWWDGARIGSINQLQSVSQFLELRGGPVNSVTSFETLDEDDVATAWPSSNYYLSASATSNVPPAKVVKKKGASWPVIDREIDAIKITHVDGFGGDYNAVPMDIRQGLLILIAHWYGQGREAVLTKITSKKIELGLKDAWSKYYEKRI